jgi:hypothetical protein
MDQTAFDNTVRLTVYGHFVSQGRAPGVTAVAAALDAHPDQVRQAFQRLAKAHVLVLQPGTHEIWMAMPFSAVPTPFRVRASDAAWWANCAWDSLGVPAMLGRDAVIETRCPLTDAPLRIAVASAQLAPNQRGVVHFAVPAARWWDDIGHT